MPEVDVLIHTGDLTNFGELGSLKESIKMIGTIQAELKLVIAGNHDVTLDPILRVENISAEEYTEYYKNAIEIVTGQLAKESGMTYLEEGIHTFKLSNGAKFTVYASPFTPGDRTSNWAFQYQHFEDRYNNANQVLPKTTSIGMNPIPTTGIDIVMTHGPPYSILDNKRGCRNLLRAVSRARPLMHCFGHIHDGHGANLVTWNLDGSVKNPERATPLETEEINEYPYTCKWSIQPRQQTLMINAAIMMNTRTGLQPHYKPFVVALDLPYQ